MQVKGDSDAMHPFDDGLNVGFFKKHIQLQVYKDFPS